MSPTVHIQCAAPQHLDAWMQLVDLLSPYFPGLDTPEALESYRQTVLKNMRRQSALCAFDGDKMVGLLLFSRKHNQLSQLGVHPDARRRHIASGLIESMLTRLDRTRDIAVVTFREDDGKGTAARALYRRFGFEPGECFREMDYPVQRMILRAP